MESVHSVFSSSDDNGQFVVAWRQMKKELEDLVRKVVKEEIQLADDKFLTRHRANELTSPREISYLARMIKEIVPMLENLVRKVVKEEIQLAGDKILTRSRANELREISNLAIKFLDEISGPVLTGKPIEGRGEEAHVRVALVDESTGEVVSCGPVSSAKVEILILDASSDEDQDFDRRIIGEGDKKKPHFVRRKYIHLDKGIGILRNAKLGHDKSWMKSCKCRLGARLMGNFEGVRVQEGTTGSFMVSDSRSKLYGKHYPPCLSDNVWRLENIRKDGPKCKQLNEANIITLQDFLFLLSIDPQRLEKIVNAGARWKDTLDHALTCSDIDDGRIYLYYPSSPGSITGVTFDVVGRLKGLIHGSHHVPVNNLSVDEKDFANTLLLAAFENKNDITSFPDENSLLHQFPLSDTNVATTSELSIPEIINGLDARDLDPSSPSWVSEPYNDTCSFSPPDQMLIPEYSNLDLLLEYIRGDESLMSRCFPEGSHTLSGCYLGGGSNSHEQANAAGRSNSSKIAAVICLIRSTQRFMASGGFPVGKRQRIF